MTVSPDCEVDASVLALLRETERRFRLVIETARDFIIIYDLYGTVLYVNPAVLQASGYSAEEVVGHPLTDFIPAEYHAGIQRRIQQRQAGKTGVSLHELEFLTRAGRRIPVEVNSSDFVQEDGRRGMLIIARDLTERRAAEAAQQESALRFRAMFEQSPVAMCRTAPDGRLLEVNAAFCRLLGYTRAEILTFNIRDVTASENLETREALIQQLLSGESTTLNLQRNYLHRDGRRIRASVQANLVRDAEGNPLYFVTYMNDLTALHAAEVTLERRAAQLAVLNEVGQQITADLDLERLLQHAAALIQERFDYHHVGLFLTDPASGKLMMRAKAGQFAHLYPPGHGLNLGEGMVGWVAQTGQTLLANDVNREPRYVNLYPDILPTAAELTVPLLTEQTVIGVLDVQSAVPNAFDENDVMAIVTLAGQIAVALQNAQLYASVQAQQAQTEALRRAGAALVGTLALEEVLDRLLEQVSELLANDAVNIMLIEGEFVRVVRARGYERFDCQPYINDFRCRLAEIPLLLQLRASGRAVVIADTHTDAEWTQYPETSWLRSYAGMPLHIRGQTIGFLNVDSATPHFFTAADAEWLNAFANQAAIALENARLFEAEQVERNRLNILYTVTQQLAAASTRDQIAQVIADALALIGVRDYDLLLLDVDGKPWIASSIPEWQGLSLTQLEAYTQQVITAGLQAWVREQRQVAVVADTHQDPRWLILAGHKARDPVRAVICVPLFDRQGDVMGFLDFSHPEPLTFPADAQQLAEELGTRVTIALENAALYEETRRRLLREEQLNALAHILGGEMRLETLLERFLPAIAALTGAESATVGLYDAATQHLIYPYHYRLPASLTGVTLDVNIGMAGRAFREGRTMMVEDYRTYADALPTWVVGGLRTVLIIPLRVEDTVIGVLELYTLSEPRPFDAEARASAEASARLISVALQRAQLFETERAQRLFAEALATASAVVNSSLELERVLELILEQVARVLPGDTYNMMLLEDGTARIVRQRGYMSADESGSGAEAFVVAAVPGLRAMATSGEPWLVSDTRQDPIWETRAGQDWIRAYVGAPIRAGENTLGFLNVNGKTPGQFGPEDAQRLKAFADQVAVALENASLYRQLQDRAQHLETLVQQRTAQLQAQVARSEAILDGTTDGVIVTDSHGNLVQVNPVAEAWLKRVLSAEEALHLQQAIEALASRAAERPTIELDLGNLDLELTAAAITSTTSDAAAVVVTAHDITQSKTLARMKSQFVSNVSHELRTPITTILLYASMLQKCKPEKQAHYLQNLLQEAERQARLVEDVLQVSRIDDARLEVKVRPVDLNNLVQSVCDSEQGAAQARALDFSCSLSQTELQAAADPERLRQILHNLLQNAFTFTGASGHVTVSTGIREAEGRWATVSVRDTGIGIPEEELPHIFERFFRGTEPRRRQVSGSGLGLAIVKEMLDMQGGKITVESQIGKGSTFIVWLPLAE